MIIFPKSVIFTPYIFFLSSVNTARLVLLRLADVLPTQLPSSQHGEVIERIYTILLNRHSYAYRHPAAGLVRWDAYRLVGGDASESTDVLDICRRVVLARRCPARDDASDGVEAVLVVVRSGEQIEGCTPAILQGFKLAETTVVLRFRHSFPLVPTSPDIQWVIITNSSW